MARRASSRMPRRSGSPARSPREPLNPNDTRAGRPSRQSARRSASSGGRARRARRSWRRAWPRAEDPVEGGRGSGARVVACSHRAGVSGGVANREAGESIGRDGVPDDSATSRPALATGVNIGQEVERAGPAPTTQRAPRAPRDQYVPVATTENRRGMPSCPRQEGGTLARARAAVRRGGAAGGSLPHGARPGDATTPTSIVTGDGPRADVGASPIVDLGVLEDGPSAPHRRKVR